MTILEKVQSLCEKKGTNLSKLEIELGFGKGTLYKWNKSSPNIDKLKKVADYFDVSIDFLANENSDSPVKLEEPEDENTVNVNILCKGAGAETIKVSREDLDIVKDIVKKFQEKRNKEL